MKNNYNINVLLVKFNKYVNKLNRFSITGRNIHRQEVLRKHIERLRIKINSIVLISKKKVAMASTVGALVLGGQAVNAQEFNNGNASGYQTNPFGLNNASTYSRRPVLVDLDNDGDLDIWGSSNGGSDDFIENIGTASAPAFAPSVSSAFNLISTNTYGYTTFADLDNDGDYDLYAGQYGTIGFYENTGTASTPEFSTAPTNYITPGGTPPKAPIFVDIDTDGDLDLFIGDYGGNILFYENTGTVSSPSFGPLQTNPFNIAGNSLTRPIPAFADLDGDADLDLIVGVRNGDFLYFENTGTSTAPSFAAAQTNPFSIANSGSSTFAFAAPTFGDLDNDGDMDMISSNYGNDFIYYENTSSSAILVSGITVQGAGGASTITTDGGTLAMSATVLPANATDGTHTWSVTNGTGSASISASGLLTALTNGTITVTATANDASGLSASTVITLSNQTSIGIHETDNSLETNIYPNPTTGIINIKANETIAKIEIFDLTGKQIASYTNEVIIDLSSFNNGVYLAKITTAKNSIVKRIIKK